MSMEHPAIDKWGMKKFGERFDLPEGTKFIVNYNEAEYSGCETCGYDSAYTDIKVKRPDEENYTFLTEVYTDLAEIMREVLDATMES